MKCKEVAAELLAARRGESEHQSEVYAHLAGCPECRELADRMGRALALLDAVGEFEPSRRPWDNIRRELASEGVLPPKRLVGSPFEIHRRMPPAVKYVAAVVVGAAAIAWLVHRQMPWRVREVVGSAGSDGSLHAKGGGEGPWVKLSPGALLRTGDRVGTPPAPRGSIGRLQLASGVSVTLNSGTLLELFDERSLYMYAGEIYVAARPGSGGFSVETGSAAVEVHGTRFTVLATTGSTRVTVLEGQVRLRGGRGQVTVGPGEAASVDKGAAPREPVRVDTAKAIGWTLEAPPKISLKLPARRIAAGASVVAEVTVANPRPEAVEIHAPGGAQPFYMFRISGRSSSESWVEQARPLKASEESPEDQAETINIAPGGEHSFKCALPRLGDRQGEYSVSVIYYSYRTEGAPKWLWTGTVESAPVSLEVTGTR